MALPRGLHETHGHGWQCSFPAPFGLKNPKIRLFYLQGELVQRRRRFRLGKIAYSLVRFRIRVRRHWPSILIWSWGKKPEATEIALQRLTDPFLCSIIFSPGTISTREDVMQNFQRLWSEDKARILQNTRDAGSNFWSWWWERFA